VFSHAEAWRVYPDVLSVLHALRSNGLHVGVISNWDERLRPLLSELGIDELLDSITVSCEAGVEKPHPEIFRAALRAANVTSHEALHVGDNLEEDVRGAEAVGMQALLLDREGRGRESAIRDLTKIIPLSVDL
jgi:putative hydrolase of the HAD superfamily